ncbi:MAG: thiosulfate oxidation carrier protein SoxY [Notoacmeibacter sp.]|nr:thiosulfate oxidation carrier protein SoxY [Notoacmeibacter sp.]
MNMNRRQALGFGAAAAAFAVTGFRAMPASASAEDAEKMVMEFAGKAPESGKISLNAPEIAENGNTVPISVSVESAMSGDDMVESVMLLADGNPSPEVATFHFTALSGSASATTRIRLAKTQNVIAVAKMKDGSVYMDKKQVKVTIGGCGG